jgi:hypothetical protein
MSFWSKIWGGLKTGGRKLLGGLQSGKKIFNTGWNFLKKIPVLGEVAKVAEASPIGKRVSNVGTGIDVADALASGDYSGALQNAQKVRLLKKGGIAGYDDGMRAMSMRIPKYKLPRSDGMPQFGDMSMPTMSRM